MDTESTIKRPHPSTNKGRIMIEIFLYTVCVLAVGLTCLWLVMVARHEGKVE